MRTRFAIRRSAVLAATGFGAVAAVAFGAVAVGAPTARGERRPQTIHAFVGVNVVPMDEERTLPDRTVIVTDDRITRIGPAGEIEIPEGAVRIDGDGLWLMPGLAEMHAHIPGSGAPRDYMENTLFLYAANGITTIRGMLGEPAHLELRERAARGEILSPRIYTSGPSLNGNSVRSPEHAREMVRDQARAGYDFLKLHPGLSLAAFDAIDETADEVGIPYAGHVSQAVGLERALKAGQATIDHLDGYVEVLAVPPPAPGGSRFFGLNLVDRVDLDELPRLARETAEAGVWNVPTMALFPQRFMEPEALLAWPEMRYVAPQQAEAWANAVRSGREDALFSDENGAAILDVRRRILLALHEADAGILLGSDAPQVFNVPGFSMHRELAEYVRAGLSPYEALRTGTVEVARFFGVADERGTVAEGMVADLVLVRGNPLDDVAAVREPAGVMLAGRWLSAGDIDDRLEAIAATYGNLEAAPEAVMPQNAPDSDPEIVDHVDLERYMGLWYEFARLPNDFQSQCAGNVTAEYTLRADGKVDVVNRCETEDGSVDEATGVARVVDEATNARLEVSFVQILGFSLFWGDYWILGLGEDYEWAVVGHPDREYGWLLVRDPDVSEDVADEMFFILESRGYRHDEFVITPQDGGAGATD